MDWAPGYLPVGNFDIYEFILDNGVDEVACRLNDDDADQVQDMIEGADSVEYDTEEKVPIFKNLMG